MAGVFKTWLGVDGSFPTKYNDADNWLSSGATGIPLVDDFVSILNNAVSINDELDQSAVVLGSFVINDSYTGRIGVAGLVGGANLQIASPIVNIHSPSADGSFGTGSDMIKLDLGSTTAAVVTIFGSSQSSAETGLEPIRLIGSNAGNKLYMLNGLVGIATSVPGEAATFSVATLSGGTLNFGAGVTLGTLIQDAGTANLLCGATTITNNGGELTTRGTGAITTVSVGGTATLSSTGTITTLNVRDGGLVDLIENRAARAITTINLYKGARIKGDTHITVTNFNLIQCGLDEVDIEWGEHRTITIAAGP